jgi:hypothetical protein
VHVTLHGDEAPPSLSPGVSVTAGVPGMLSVSNARQPGDPGCVPQASRLLRAVQATGCPAVATGGAAQAALAASPAATPAGDLPLLVARNGMGLRDTSQLMYSCLSRCTREYRR